MTMREPWFARISIVVLLLLGPAADRPAAEEHVGSGGDDRSRAVDLYSRGEFQAARAVLEQIDAEGKADGTLLYRLAYCQRVGGDAETASATQERARELLEQQVASADAIEVPFYLVNTYQNLGRDEDMRRVAAETVARVERGELTIPERGIDMFRLGKLYADQGVETKALEWYSRSVDAMVAEGGSEGAYLRWASRYIAERAFRAEDFAAAQRHYTILLDLGEGTPADLDRLAVARTRLGMYEEAAQAWKQSELLGPPDPNRARYCYNLATMAAEVGELPANEPSGRPWKELNKADLEKLMSDQSARVKQTQAEAQEAETMTKERRAELRSRLKEVKRVFVAAALEYAVRGYSIRETAFFGGYAPLIFRKAAWRLGRPAKKKRQAGEEGDAGDAPGS